MGNNPDRIFIEGLAVNGKHGVLPHEWSHEQRFLVDIVVACDTRKSAHSDTVEHTINYADLCTIARNVIEGTSVYLIERLAHEIAERVLEEQRVQSVTVTIRKPTVLASGVPGVTIERIQS